MNLGIGDVLPDARLHLLCARGILDQSLGGGGDEMNVGLWSLACPVVRNAYDGAVLHQRVLEEMTLEFGGSDLVALDLQQDRGRESVRPRQKMRPQNVSAP